MKIRNWFYKLLAFICVVSLACNLSLPGRDTSKERSSPGTVFNENGEPVELEPLPQDVLSILMQVDPEDDAQQARILIASLKLLAGEELDNDPFKGSEIEFFEGTGVLSIANQYLETGKDKKAKEEIQRLLNVLLPPRENIDRFSAPESGKTAGNQSIATVSKNQTMEACRDLWKRGFNADQASIVCLLYKEATVNGHTYRLYYPESQSSNAGYMDYVDAANDAIVDSILRYGEFTSEMKNFFVIFALVQNPVIGSSGLARATTHWGEMNRDITTCPIVVYPASFEETTNDFKQVIAHEMFHCVQGWVHTRAMRTNSAWYIEGGATYFSGLIYPTNNLEQRFQSLFDKHSLETSILEMSYENSIFFQYMANVMGNEKVFGLMNVLDPLGTADEHAVQLKNYDVDNEFLQDFGRKYLEKDIEDEGGGSYPILVFYRGVDKVDESTTLNYDAHPFHLARYLIKYKEKTDYELSPRETGDGLNNVKEWPNGEIWRPLPSNFQTKCGEPGDTLLLTTVEPGSDYQLEIDVNVGESYFCRCVVGTWSQESSEIASHVNAVLSGGISLESMSGQLILVVDEAGGITLTPIGLSGVFKIGDESPIELRVSGVSTSTYKFPEGAEDTKIIVTPGETNLAVTAIADGTVVPFPLGPEAFAGGPFAEGGTFEYTCDDTTLTALIPDGAAPFTSTTYKRISEVPATPVPAPEVDTPGGGGEAPPIDIPGGGDSGAGASCSGFSISGFSASSVAVSWLFTNGSGEPYTLTNLSLKWPASNGTLTSITLDGTPIWSGSLVPDLAIVDRGWLGTETERTVPAGSAKTLTLLYSGGSMGTTGYIMSPEFTNGCITADVR